MVCDGNFAVSGVGVADHGFAGSIYQGYYVALQVGDIVVNRAIVLQRVRSAVGIIEEVQGIAAIGFPQQLITGIVISMSNSVGLLGQPLSSYSYYTAFFAIPQEKKSWNHTIPGLK